jgi:choline dehydrogenase
LAPLGIDPGHLTDSRDLPRIIAGLDLARQLVAAPPLKRCVTGVAESSRPLLSLHGSELSGAVVDQLNTYHHPVGTCRMGTAVDEMAVVDNVGRVHGVNGLSIIDAAIFPSIPTANTNVPTMMAAEHLAPTFS